MEISPAQPMAEHSCHAKTYQQYRSTTDIFQTNQPPARYLTTHELSQILTARKITAATPAEYQQIWMQFVISAVAFGILLAWSGINYTLADPIIQRRAPKSICTNELSPMVIRIVDTRQGNTIIRPWDVVPYCPLTTNLAGLSPNISTWLLAGILGLLALTYSGVNLIAIIKKYNILVESAQNHNIAIDATLSELSALSPMEEVLPRDIALAFPYLSTSELPLLNFLQLKAARKKHLQLFEDHLHAGLYAKKQLAIWRLFHQIVTATPPMQKKILSCEKSQSIIGCDPFFFQKVVKHFKLLDDTMCGLCVQILKARILHPNIAQTALDTKLLIHGLAEGKSLPELILGTA